MGNGSRIRIRIDDTSIPVRDFGWYLSFVDRSYGRLASDSLRSYAQTREDHLSISKVRSGSFEIIIEEAIRHSPYLVALFLVLKYLPAAIKASFEAYQSLQESRLAQAQTEEIRRRLDTEPVLSGAGEDEKRKVAESVSEVYSKEQHYLPASVRFSEEHVISVEIEDI